MSPQRKPQTAGETAKEALDRAVADKTPTRRALDYLLADNEPPPTPVTPVTDVTPVTRGAAPARDFTRTANSIVREAVPAGVFTGKGKQLYDYLYSQTRGAIVPKMTARIPTEAVMKGAGMTRHPFRAHIARLISFGLVKVTERAGKHGGNDYTVFLPEEADPGHRGDRGHTGDKVPVEQGSQAHPGDRGLSPDFQRTSGESKTSIKTTTTDDDEAMPLLRARIGKAPRTEAILLSLLDTLEARTDVASPDALLAHVLRQKLSPRGKAPQREPSEEQFQPAPVTQFTEEEMAELRQIEADIRAELSKTSPPPP